MSESQQRAHGLIEELRADIDFEIDDVISQIVLGLPEDYFRGLSRSDQMKHLKALLALGVCNVDQEIMMPSNDDKFVVVVARKNYPGLLARILNQLPNPGELIGAKIFTSKEQDFIIDLFEYRSEHRKRDDNPVRHLGMEEKIASVARLTGQPLSQVSHFAGQYEPDSPVFDDQHYLASQYAAFKNVLALQKLSVHWEQESGAESGRLTVASTGTEAFELFRSTAGYLAEQECDIDQAVLNDFASRSGKRVSIASFRILPGQINLAEHCQAELAKRLD